MFKRLFVGCAAVLAASAVVVHAAPADDVQAAAKKLAESGYTYKTTNEGGGGGGGGGGARAGGGGQTGKVDKDGTALLTIARGDAQTLVVVGKDGKGAVKSGDEGWKSVAELEAAAGDQPNPGRMTARIVRAFKAPAAQAEALATKAKDLKKTDDGFAGDLTEEGVKELMAFGGGRRGGAGGGGNAPAAAPAVKDGKGTVAFTVKDGALARVKYTVQGKVTFGDQEREVNRTTTIEFTDVGSTKVEVPAEAKAKL